MPLGGGWYKCSWGGGELEKVSEGYTGRILLQSQKKEVYGKGPRNRAS